MYSEDCDCPDCVLIRKLQGREYHAVPATPSEQQDERINPSRGPLGWVVARTSDDAIVHPVRYMDEAEAQRAADDLSRGQYAYTLKRGACFVLPGEPTLRIVASARGRGVSRAITDTSGEQHDPGTVVYAVSRVRLLSLPHVTASVFDTGAIDGEPVVYVHLDGGTNAALTLDVIERL